jgi:hypothetical protein
MGHFFHGLERYRVNYGLFPCSKTKWQYHYSATIQSNVRSTVILIWNCLQLYRTYYQEGLTESQLAALSVLSQWVPLPKRISTGVDQQRVGRYIKSCQSSDHILKVDVGNKLQLGLIHENPSACRK